MARRIRIPHFAPTYGVPCTAYSFRVLSRATGTRTDAPRHRSIDYGDLGTRGATGARFLPLDPGLRRSPIGRAFAGCFASVNDDR